MLFNLTFEGNLAADPELYVTPSGKAVCRMRVGYNTRRRNANGDWGNGPTVWFTVTAWEDLAERLAESLRRGDTVIVEARDDLSIWAYLNQTTNKPAGQLQVTAANVALSMRFRPATAQRPKRAAFQEPVEAPWSDQPDSDADVDVDAAATERELQPAT